jgi:hypothetical protein
MAGALGRRSCRLALRVTRARGECGAMLIEVSATGGLLRGLSGARPGERLALTLGGQRIEGWVTRASAAGAEIAFSGRLGPEALLRLARAA